MRSRQSDGQGQNGRGRGPGWMAGWAASSIAIVGVVAALAATVLAPVATGASSAISVSTAQNKLGKILVDASGHALYVFTKDPNGQSMCTGSCTQKWQPLLGTAATAKSGSGLNAKLFGAIKRATGGSQLTYDHHPLYVYTGDKTSKTTNGEGATEFGGRWYLIGTSGQEIKPKSSGPCNPVCSGY